MKLTGNLKKQVEKVETREAARDAIASAGMLLNDDELDQVAGGTEPDVKIGSMRGPQRCAKCKKELPIGWKGAWCQQCEKKLFGG